MGGHIELEANHRWVKYNYYYYFFSTKVQKVETFFFFFIKLNILRVVLQTQHFQKNLTTKSSWQVVKGR